MRKSIALILILSCLLALAGCKPGQQQAVPSTAVPSSIPPSQATTPTTQAPPPTTQPTDPNGIPLGTIFITEALQQALAATDDENEEFAVVVGAMPGITKDQVYDTFVKQLNIAEDYQKWGILYLTKAQINAAVCPSDYWLTFMLGSAAYNGMEITVDNLHWIKTDTREVQITYKTTGYTSDQYPQLEKAVCDAYGITEDMIIYSFPLFNRFTATIDTSLLAQMLEDERINYIVDVHPSLDLGQGGGGTPSETTKSPIIAIRNQLDENCSWGYDLALERIYEDGNKVYRLSGMYSHLIIVYYLDGTTEDIKTALNAGRATIADLDRFGIDYYVD